MAIADILIISVGATLVAEASGVVVDKAAILAKFLKISPFVIGLVLVATTTNLPELTLAVLSLFNGSTAISAANVFGANVTNVALVFGAGALIYGFSAGRKIMKSAELALLLSLVVSAYIILHSHFFGSALGLPEAIVLLALFVWFAASSLREKPIVAVAGVAAKGKKIKAKEKAIGSKEGMNALWWFIGAVVVLVIASYFVLQSAISLAGEFGLTTGFIGATVIALGTTLPELSVTLQAFRKKYYDIGLGDTIGSVITNSTLVLGVASLGGLVLVPLSLFAAACLFVCLTLLVFRLMGIFSERFDWKQGLILLLIYVLYIAAATYMQIYPDALPV